MHAVSLKMFVLYLHYSCSKQDFWKYILETVNYMLVV